MTTHPAPNVEQLKAKARALVASRTTAQLCADFALSETLPVTDPAVPMTRGWLMDELERRDAAAFDAWVLSDQELPHQFFGITDRPAEPVTPAATEAATAQPDGEHDPDEDRSPGKLTDEMTMHDGIGWLAAGPRGRTWMVAYQRRGDRQIVRAWPAPGGRTRYMADVADEAEGRATAARFAEQIGAGVKAKRTA